MCRHFHNVVDWHRVSLARQNVYSATFKRGDLVVIRYPSVGRSRWLENTYEMEGASRKLEAADIYLLRFEATAVGGKEARTLCADLTATKASMWKLTLDRCQISTQGLLTLILRLKSQEVSVYCSKDARGVTCRRAGDSILFI